METFFSAILSDLASRSISLMISKYSKPTVSIMEERLQRLLLRARIIVEEAEERLITNHAMLQQLNILRKEMYRGYYTLDKFRCHDHEEDNTKDHQVSNSFAPSKFNPAKRVRCCKVSGQSLQQQQQQVFSSLEAIIEDMSEFVMFLNSCPRLCRQPYSMHLLLDNCLFGRQMEMEHIMNFLLKEDNPSAETPGVLPIIGPAKVGKSTLIEHACNNERVRNQFCKIVCFSDNDFEHTNMVTLRDCGLIKHQNHTTDGERILIIIELVRDIDDSVWRRLYSASKKIVTNGSKIIVASRSDKVVSFGTTQALRVKFFTEEAYWYFFKVRTFGSLDAEEHPKLASIAMDMAREMEGCFMGSCIYSVLLKANLNTQLWSTALARIREFKYKNNLIYNAYFAGGPWEAAKPAYVRRVNNISSEYLVILEDYQTCSVQDMVHRDTDSGQIETEVSKVSIQDFLFGSARPQGKFKVLAWRSHLPPHYNYIFNCETSPTMEERLQQLLRRVRIIVEEAEERLITNHSMLQQLNILRKEMYRGYYILDKFRCHDHEEDNTRDHQVSSSFASSKFNPAKRIRFCRVSGQSSQEHLMQQVLSRIEVTIEDMSEFVMFLNSYPRMCRQPYSMYLLLDNCLFSRQMEMEHIMDFLLKEDAISTENLGVLPIIGPGKVGKSTLIGHACDDERVRNHFSQIVCFSSDDLEDANMVTLGNCGVIKHQNQATGGERILIIVELIRDIDEGAWRRLYSASKNCVASGSKIIVSSRSEKIASFGTTQALRVKSFTQEAYWYFFKLRAFGSVDASEHPKMESIAMDIAIELNACLMGSSVYTVLLRQNFNTQFWSMALARIREFRKLNHLLYDAKFFDSPWEGIGSAYVRRLNKICCEDHSIIHCHAKSALSEDEVPMVSVHDFLFGSVKLQGKFKVLAWRSHLPPYSEYVFNCEVERSYQLVTRSRKKRPQKLCT
uniref:NB-ARC domain-containing protein n=1 Tax=Leersia perrieri TaxID=77586 RepID=A0A0D9WUW9_9ORYZ